MTVDQDLGEEMCAYYRDIGIFAHERPVRAVVDRLEALTPAWMHAMHGGSLTREAIPRYTQALRERAFAYDGRLLGRDVVKSDLAVSDADAAPADGGYAIRGSRFAPHADPAPGDTVACAWSRRCGRSPLILGEVDLDAFERDGYVAVRGAVDATGGDGVP